MKENQAKRYMTYADGCDKPKLEVLEGSNGIYRVRTPEGVVISIPEIYLMSWEYHLEILRFSKP